MQVFAGNCLCEKLSVALFGIEVMRNDRIYPGREQHGNDVNDEIEKYNDEGVACRCKNTGGEKDEQAGAECGQCKM